MTAPLLSYRDFTLTYAGAAAAVRGVSFDLFPGECLALVGESGCGKTSIARAAIGLAAPGATTSGAILFRGENLLAAGEGRLRTLRGREIGYVAQDPFEACNPLATIHDHVAEAWRAHGERPPAGAVAQRLAAAGIEDAENRMRQYPHQWSGGMLQRASIAAAAGRAPALIVADEPTSALDTDRADATLAMLRKQGAAVLLISHDLGLVARHADRIAVCYAGRIVEIGSARAIAAAPRHPYAAGLLAALPMRARRLPMAMPGSPPRLDQPITGCSFAPRCADATERCRSEDPPLKDGLACHVRPTPRAPVTAFRPVAATARAQEDARPLVVEARALRKVYGAQTAVASVDLRVRGGEIVGISGASGCGKSTLLRLLGGIEPPDGGALRYGFEETRGPGARPRLPAGSIMPIFQNALGSLNPRWPIWRSVTEPLATGRNALPREGRIAAARGYLADVGLDHIDPRARPLELSIGQCQRVAIARVLAARPALVIADEPTSSLDVSATATILHLLDGLARRGAAIIIVSHNRPLLDSLCSRVLPMADGTLSDSTFSEARLHDAALAPPAADHARRVAFS